MVTSEYNKSYPRCGKEIEPERYATKGDKAFGGVTAVSRTLIGGDIGTVAGYFAGKPTIMFIESDHDINQWFK